MKTNIKLRVTPEQSEAVQKICFANGVFFMGAKDKISYTSAEYLFIDHDRIWYRDYAEHNIGAQTLRYTEVDADLFIRTNGTCEESIDIVDNLSNNKSKEDMFKQYGFEVPDFDCAILTKVNHDYVGYVVNQDVVLALSWYKDGFAYGGMKSYTQYNLTPIKNLGMKLVNFLY